MNEEMPIYTYTTLMKRVMGRQEMFTREELELLMGEKKEEKTANSAVQFGELNIDCFMNNINQIQHTDADIVVIGDYRISVAPGHNVLKSSFKEVDDYLNKNFGIADGTQAAMSFVCSFYGVPECNSMTLSHWRLFQIALVCYILGKTKRSMSVHFAGGRIHYDLTRSVGYEEVYPAMFRKMWQREPTVAKVATSYMEVTWIMGNGRPAEIEDKPDDDFKVKYSVPLKLSVSKPSVSFNFD